MKQRETFAEFAKRVKPKDGDKFKDINGIEWTYKSGSSEFYNRFIIKGHDDKESLVRDEHEGKYLTHDFVEPPKPKLLAPGVFFSPGDSIWHVSSALFSSLEEFNGEYGSYKHKIWPAIPNAQGFYEVE